MKVEISTNKEDIDWTKVQIVQSNYGIYIVCEPNGCSQFNGICLKHEDHECVGTYSEWTKNGMRPFTGKITLSND